MTSRQIDAGKAVFTLDLQDRITKRLATLQKRIQGAADKAANIGTSLNMVGTKLAGIGTAITAFGATGLAGFAKATLAAGDFAETVSKFETVFGDQASAIRSWAQTFGKQVGRSEADLVRFLATVQDTFVPLGFDPQEAAELSKRLTTLSVDLASFNNISDGEAFDRLISAVVGNTENLRAFGVVAQDAQIKAEALAQGFDPKALTPYQKALAIVSLTMKGTEAAQGDALRTAGSFNNRVKALVASISNLTNAIGGPLLGPATRLVETITAAIEKVEAFAKANSGVVKRVAALAAGITAAGAAVLGVGVSIAGVGFIFSGIGAAIAGVTATIATLGTVIAGAFTVAITPVGLLVGGITAATVATAKFSGAFDNISAAFSGIPKSVLAGIQRIQTALEDGGIATAAKQLKTELARVGEVSALNLQIAWKKALDFVQRIGETVAVNLAAAFNAAVANITSSLGTMAGAVHEAIKSVNDALNQFTAKSVGDAVTKGLGKDNLLSGLVGSFAETALKGQLQAETQIADFGGDIQARVAKLSEDLKANADAFQTALAGVVSANQETREGAIQGLVDRLRQLESTPVEITVDTATVVNKLKRAFSEVRRRFSVFLDGPNESANVSDVRTTPGDSTDQGKTLTTTDASIAANAAAFAPTVDDPTNKQILDETRKQTDQSKTLAQKLETLVSRVGEVAGSSIAGAVADAQGTLQGALASAMKTLEGGIEINYADGPQMEHAFSFADLDVPSLSIAAPDLSIAGMDADGAATEDTQKQMAKSLDSINRKVKRRSFGV